MSLNCLTLRRADSENELKEGSFNHEKPNFGLCWAKVERSWSGNLAPRPYDKVRNEAKSLGVAKRAKKTQHRLHTNSGPVEFGTGAPKLVRSCGMRRDWSFEDLRQRRDEKIIEAGR